MFLSLFCFFISLFLVVDLFEIELVTRVFLVLEVPEEGHREDPDVREDKQSHSEPLIFIRMCGAQGAMAPEDQDLQAVIADHDDYNLEDVLRCVHVEALVVLDFLLEIGKVGVDLLLG